MALSKAQKKYVAIQRAKRRLEHRLEDIDWEEEVLLPEVEKIAELEQTQRVEIEVGDGSRDQN